MSRRRRSRPKRRRPLGSHRWRCRTGSLCRWSGCSGSWHGGRYLGTRCRANQRTLEQPANDRVTLSELEPLKRGRECRNRPERRRIDGSAGAGDSQPQGTRHPLSGARREYRVQQMADFGFVRFFARRVLDASVREKHQVVEPQRTRGTRVPRPLKELLDYCDRFVRSDDDAAVEQLLQRNCVRHVPGHSCESRANVRVSTRVRMSLEVCPHVSPIVDDPAGAEPRTWTS